MVDYTVLLKLLVIGSPGILCILALLLSAYFSTDSKTLGPGPRCDICGELLKDHNMYSCETYC